MGGSNDLLYELFAGRYEFIVLIGVVVFSLLCSVGVKTTFAKYNRVRTQSGETAAEIARKILDMNGLYNVQVVHIAGNLTDHYDPRTNTVALSDTVYSNATVGAVGVAAHECGHAVQHARGYIPIKIRQAVFPVVNICSMLWVYVLLAGFLFQWLGLVQVGILVYAAVVFFQLVTLPVEFNASGRALRTLKDNAILTGSELSGAGKTLTAAAMTYIASFLSSLVQLLRLLMSSRRRS